MNKYSVITLAVLIVAFELLITSLGGWGILSLVDAIASTDFGSWLNGLYLAVAVKLVRIFL